MSKTDPKENFESQLKALETIVNKMERDDLALQESLDLFEQGVRLTQTCQKALDDAEQKVRIITGQNS